MFRSVPLGVLLSVVLGCAAYDEPLPGSPECPVAVVFENPALVPEANHELVWETIVDVVDDDFVIEREDRVRQYGDVMTEGRLDTYPLVGSTILEPWHHDAANLYEKVEGTLQSIRRRAVVRVSPTQGGHWVEVVVFKELEDVARPLRATAGEATFRYDNSLSRVVNPVGEQPTHRGWIPMGRDTALEQKILSKIQSRLAHTGPRFVPLAGLWPSPSTSR